MIILLGANNLLAQDTTLLAHQRHHFIKYNCASMFALGAAFHYEYVLNDNKSIQLGYTHSYTGLYFSDWKYRVVNADMKFPIRSKNKNVVYSGVATRWFYNNQAIDYDENLTPIFEKLNHYGIGAIVGFETFGGPKRDVMMDLSVSAGYQFVDKKTKYEYYEFTIGKPLMIRIGVSIGFGLF